MLATANLSRGIAHVRTTRPTHRWTNQHGQAHQQVNETGEHVAVKGGAGLGVRIYLNIYSIGRFPC